MSDRVIQAEIIEVALPLQHPFTTGFGTIRERSTLLLKLTTAAGLVGWGECAALTEPIYLEECISTCKVILQQFLLPEIIGQAPSPSTFRKKTARFKRQNLAKFSIETALWWIEAARTNRSLWHILGGKRKKVKIGASISIQPTVELTLQKIQAALDQGIQRIKIKIQPGWDLDVVAAIRQQFPQILLMVDANSSYTLEDSQHLQKLDTYSLLMIEQPLGYDDIIDHATLQKSLSTRVCLDESLLTIENVRQAIELQACRIINVKPARMASLLTVQEVNTLAKKAQLPLWCGGMLESDIAKCANLAAASLSEFSLPADISPANTYYSSAITHLDRDCYSHGEYTLRERYLPEVNESWIQAHTVERITLLA